MRRLRVGHPEGPSAGSLEVLAGDGDDIAETLPSGTGDEQRPQVGGTYVRYVHWELLSVHEPVDGVPLSSPANKHRN